MATAVAADACGVADRTGTLETRKAADLLVVAGDPLTNLSALHDAVAVYARGKLVEERHRPASP